MSKLKSLSNSNLEYTEMISTLNSLVSTQKDTVLKNIDASVLNKINYFNLLFDIPTILNTYADDQILTNTTKDSFVTDKEKNEYMYQVSLGIKEVVQSNTYSLESKNEFNIETIKTDTQRLKSLETISNYYISELSKIDITSKSLSELNNVLKNNDLNKVIDKINNIQIDKTLFNKFTFLYVTEDKLLTASPLILPVQCINEICILNGKYDVTINNNNFNIEYDLKPATQKAGSVRVPIMMYHLIDIIPKNASTIVKSMYITPKDFETQIAYLTQKNYRTITTAQYAEMLNSGTNPSQKTIMLTFDDGTIGQYKNAFPILKKYKQVGVFFIPSESSAINSTQMKEMVKAGMDIQSHSTTHPNFKNLASSSELKHQIFTSKSELQYITGVNVVSLAYPGCVWDDRTLNYMHQAGYSLGFSCGSTIDNLPAHRFVLSRIHAYKELSILIKILSGRF